MSMLSKDCTAGRSVSSSSVATGEGFLALPKRIVDQIMRGEYADFAELPPAKGRSKGVPHALDGQVVLVQAVDLN